MSGKVRSSLSSSMVRLTMACVVAAASTAACGTSNSASGPNAEASTPAATRPARAEGCVVGVAWYAIASWGDVLEPRLVQAISAAGATYLEQDAKATSQNQVDQIDGFVAAGARVIVMEPTPDNVYLPAVQRAIKAGVPIISIVRPLEHAPTLYVDFDPVEQGRQEARALLAAKPRGTYAIIEADASWPQTRLMLSGIEEILQPAVDRGDIRIVATVPVQWGDAGLANLKMAKILSQNGGSVDAVATDREMTWGVKDALKDAQLTGKVAMAGAGTTADQSGIASVVDGTQIVQSWGDPGQIAATAAQAAVALCRDPDITKVAGSVPVTWPGRDPMRAILLPPVAITKDNLSIVVQSSAFWRDVICSTNGRVYTPPPACEAAPASTEPASAQSNP